MIIGFLPPSNWKGANLVTHELHRGEKKMQPGNETAVCFPNSSSRIYCRAAKPYRAEPIVLAILLEGAFTLTYPGSGPVI